MSASSQILPENIVILSSSDLSERNHSPRKLLCNWRHCNKGPRGDIALAERLCPFCHRVGYCCTYCMGQDIYAHTTHECAKNIKTPRYRRRGSV